MRLKGVISGRGQLFLKFNHSMDAAIYIHVQTNRNNACSQKIETSTTNEPIDNCNQHLSNSQLYLAIHPITMAN